MTQGLRSPPGNAKKLAEMQRILPARSVPAGSRCSGSTTSRRTTSRSRTEPTFEGNALLKARAGLAADRAALARRRLRALRRRAQRHARRALGPLGRPGQGRRRATTRCCSTSSPTCPTSAAARTSPARSRSAARRPASSCVEGRMAGRVIRETRGSGGFGYDVLFVADDQPAATTAELSIDDKDAISHRGKALREIAPIVAKALGG